MSPNSRRTATLSLILETGGGALYHAKGAFRIFRTTMKEVITNFMNNRIMAMLFALVAAMFISIVPVKAEAACVCADKVPNIIRHTLKKYILIGFIILTMFIIGLYSSIISFA